jgi:hypothetical protein
MQASSENSKQLFFFVRYDLFRDQFKPLYLRLVQASQEMIALADVLTQLNVSLPMSQHFTADEIKACVLRMSQDVTSIMYDADMEQILIV